MEFRLLGPLEVRENGGTIEIGAAKERTLLAVLLLNANRVVSSDRLIEALWGERAPGTATKALQVYVSHLRKAIGRDRILTRAPGYELRVEPGELDVERFEQLVTDRDFEKALRLWHGSPLADFAYEPFAQADIARLEELRLTCIEQRIEADLADGRHATLVGELEALVREHPLRERVRAQLMLALYRSGRQAEALDVYQSGRTLLAQELGLEPSPELKDFQRAILAHDPALAFVDERPQSAPGPRPPMRESPSAEPELRPREVRKTVTVLSCDVAPTGRSLDPEPLRRLNDRGFEQLLPLLERHGANVERSLGGAVTAVFGLPTVHEDDGLRAVHAAAEMRTSFADLRDEFESQWGAWLELRVGIGTGEVVAGGDSRHPSAVGEPFQAAFRLCQSAGPGELLLDASTYRLVRDVVEIEPADDHFRLVGLRPSLAGYVSRFDSPMVGRIRERRRLHDAFEQAVADNSSQLFTVLGSPGVGKSRLVQEFVDDLADRALVARGRCLPYGEGITYWPVLEAVRDAAELDESDSPEESLRMLASVLEGNEEAILAAERVGEVIGLTATPGGAEESFWAVRTFFEALARRRPLVVVFDDIHWGEATFLDLVDYVSEWVEGAPILLVCVARPELLDLRPQWGGGKLNSTSVRLEPLSETESVQLVDNLAGPLEDASRQHVVDAAGGNPLFVEEMLALLLEDGHPGTSLEVPPTIQALLAARLDRLADEEREVIEAASVEGKIFHDGAVAELVGASSRVEGQLFTLVRKELIRPDRALFPGEDAHAFRHLLIRDAAYESIPKGTRAVMHERYAGWLEQKAGDRTLEFEEILGYHLEQAFHYRSELGALDEAARELGVRAGRRLGVAGRRALARGDTPAALNLVSRAAPLLSPADPLRVHILPGVRIAQGLGDQLAWADSVLTDAIASGDPCLSMHARVQQALLALFMESTVNVEELVATGMAAIELFEKHGDELGLARAWRLLQQARYLGRQSAASVDAAEEALRHARRADDALEEVEVIDWLGVALFMGATPASEAVRRVESHLEEVRAGRGGESVLLGCLAGMRAMQGQLVEARAVIDRIRPLVEPAYMSRQYVVPFHLGWTELLADDPEAAERALRPTLEPLEAIGETSGYCAIVAQLAEAAYRQGRYEEAEEWTRVSERASHLNDVYAHITWRRVRAKALARRGELGEAEMLIAETLAFAAGSDFLNAHGDALLDLAEVLELAGRPQDAIAAIDEAIVLFEKKENVVSTARARAALARLEATV